MATVSSVNSTASTSATPDSVAGSNSTLNQQDFLQLLVAQIQYQDPMNPQSNTDMAAQLAQFTALSQATASSSSLAMLQANSLIGSTVNIQIDSKTQTSGVVSGVSMVSGSPQIVVNNADYNLSQVTSVSPTAATTTPATATSTDTLGTAPAAPATSSSNP